MLDYVIFDESVVNLIHKGVIIFIYNPGLLELWMASLFVNVIKHVAKPYTLFPSFIQSYMIRGHSSQALL